MANLAPIVLRLLGLQLTQAFAKAAVESLVKSSKTQYDDQVWEKVKKTMNW